jgi:predicted metalloprotease with PDZ domain
VLAFLLDAKIRKATAGAKSLDDVMRAAYARYSGPRGYTPDEFRQVAEQVAGTRLNGFWDAAVQGTAELDYAEALETLGLRFRSTGVPNPTRAWLGATTRNDAGRLVVSQVRRDTPAMAAGLNVDDEILAIGDFRVRADQLATRLEQYKPGDRVPMLVARRDQLLRLDVTFGAEPPRAWRLEVNPAATDAQVTRLGQWLQPKS